MGCSSGKLDIARKKIVSPLIQKWIHDLATFWGDEGKKMDWQVQETDSVD
jgi:hypothetical protein